MDVPDMHHHELGNVGQRLCFCPTYLVEDGTLVEGDVNVETSRLAVGFASQLALVNRTGEGRKSRGGNTSAMITKGG